MRREATTQLLGRYIVSDVKICHGKPTFRGTRVLVSDVLDQVASGMDWEVIMEEWNNTITKESIREAVQLASQALLKHAHEFINETYLDLKLPRRGLDGARARPTKQ